MNTTESVISSEPVFRVSAVAADWTGNEDVLLSDRAGHAYLFSAESSSPEPLDSADADSLGMFFEPTIDVSWHSLVDLRRLLFRESTGYAPGA